MKVRFGFVLVLLTMSTLCYAQRYAVADGNWTGSIWASTPAGAPGSAPTPTDVDDVFTNGRLITVAANATCRNLTVSNVPNSITINPARSIEVTGELSGVVPPTQSLITFSSASSFLIFTGANRTPSSSIISNWSTSSPLRTVDFSLVDNFSIDSDILVTDYLSISLGTLELNSSYSITCNVIDILSGVTFNAMGTVNISGDFPNAGSALFSNIIFNGTSQNISDAGLAEVVNMTINNNSAVTNNSNIDLTGTLTLVGSSSFDADGSSSGTFRLISTSLTETGRIATLPDPNLLTGDVTVQRFINGPDAWRYLAMPISNGTVATWQSTDFPVTGNFSNPSPVDDDVVAPNAPSIYYWDGDNQEWVAVGNGSATGATSMPNNRGYSAWSYRTTDVVLSSTGAINKGSIQTTLGVGSGDDGPGWNLIANPYPSQIDWDNVTIPSGMDAAISVQRKNETAFAYYNPNCGCPPTDPPTGISNWTGEIAVGQSFWASASTADDPVVFTFTENDKTSQESEYIRKSEQKDYFKIVLASETQHDAVIVWFGDEATRDFDPKYDARKRTNAQYMNFSTFTDDPQKDFAINGLPSLGCPENIGLRVRNVSPGNYSLTFKDLNKLYLGYTIKLIDHFANKEIVAENDLKYDFAVTSDPTSYGSSRFEIEFALAKPIITIDGFSLQSSSESGNQWFRDGIELKGETGSVLNTTQSGEYTVQVTQSGCNVISDPIAFIVTDVTEQNASGVRYYPNPIEGKLTVTLPAEFAPTVRQIVVYDVLGAQVMKEDDSDVLRSGILQFDFSEKKAGNYIMNILSDKAIIALRLIRK